MNARTASALAELTSAERQVADLLPIEARSLGGPRGSRRRSVLVSHLRAQSGGGDLRAGTCARPSLPASGDPGELRGLLGSRHRHASTGSTPSSPRRRGAERVVAVDNEQYIEWVRARWDVELEGGEGFRAIHALLDSKVEYRKLDALELDRLAERFDFIFCCGILHRVETPARLLRVLQPPARRGRQGFDRDARRLPRSGRRRSGAPLPPGRGLPGRRLRLLGLHGPPGSRCLGVKAASSASSCVDAPVVDGHPRLIGWLRR